MPSPPVFAPTAYRITPEIRGAVEAQDRSEEDKAIDKGRRPADMLAFFGIAPGQKVAEIGSGGGYTAELLARVVGPRGTVYGINSPFVLDRFAQKPWTERLEKPVMQNVIRLDRAFDDPFPPEAKGLDAVLCILFYHDLVWQNVDRAKMNRAVYNALKPGGVYGIVDHSSRQGVGLREVEILHRIEESEVRKEVEAAGFVLEASADFLRYTTDSRDWNASPKAAGEKRGTSDRFVLKYVRPPEPSH